ncbi:jg22133 [Pararge aegeria aegeria]|uniref:Jg22133 protein n=1 Tax=Pararge aegeria aegeria TaxID=348720 RepID=A0A8S4RRB5_9NEOP|nr:jg22133 [Pararge aegeria aegeria]
MGNQQSNGMFGSSLTKQPRNLKSGVVTASSRVAVPSVKKTLQKNNTNQGKVGKPRSANKTRLKRSSYSSIKQLLDDKVPVMLAFVTSKSQSRLRLENNDTKSMSLQNFVISRYTSKRKSFKTVSEWWGPLHQYAGIMVSLKYIFNES